MTGLTSWPGAPAGEYHGFPGEKRSEGHAVDPVLLEAEQGRGRGVGLDDPAPWVHDHHSVRESRG